VACRICGRGACTESFHSIQDQEEWQTKTGRYAPEDTEDTQHREQDAAAILVERAEEIGENR
jgi:hypothetical protein